MESRIVPDWQRAICGVLAAGGGVALVIGLCALLEEGTHLLGMLLPLTGACYGFFLFAFVAVKGRLPRYMRNASRGRQA
jgi:hypothetical protein